MLHTGSLNRVWAQDMQGDTLETPFLKGRWLSGLSGSFSSNTLKLESEDELISSNSFALEVFTGTFFRDRWFVGLNMLASNSSSAGLFARQSETLLIGPSVSHYFLREHYGSLYLNVLPGYIRIREEDSVRDPDTTSEQLAEGQGFSSRIRLGYSYVIGRRIVLDVGVGTNLSWLGVEYTLEGEAGSRSENLFSNTTFFSFGFNVLLDEFFF